MFQKRQQAVCLSCSIHRFAYFNTTQNSGDESYSRMSGIRKKRLGLGYDKMNIYSLSTVHVDVHETFELDYKDS